MRKAALPHDGMSKRCLLIRGMLTLEYAIPRKEDEEAACEAAAREEAAETAKKLKEAAISAARAR